MQPIVYIVMKKADSIARELGFTHEIQPFVDGKAVDEVELTSETKAEIVARFKLKYDEVRINGK